MSDARLRELERRWRETQALADEAAYLQERRRVGELSQDHLELAALCGHDAAQLALGGTRSFDQPSTLSALRRVPLRTCLDAAIAAADAVAGVWRAARDTDDAERAISAAREAVACPCDEHEEKAALAACWVEGVASEGVRLGFESVDLVHVQAGKAAGAAAEAASAAALGEEERARGEGLRAVEHALRATNRERVLKVIATAALNWPA